jgi:hypothetical protein
VKNSPLELLITLAYFPSNAKQTPHDIAIEPDEIAHNVYNVHVPPNIAHFPIVLIIKALKLGKL